MALSGLDIYKLLPKTNCKECGFATCLAFAMQLAQKKVSLEKCPYVTAEARVVLESASQPPVKLVSIGTGNDRLEIGNETVMFRHEQKFYHPPGIGFLVEDTLDPDNVRSRIIKINELKFERVGLSMKPDLVAIKNTSGSKEKFLDLVKTVVAGTRLNLVLISSNADALKEAIGIAKARRPLIMAPDKKNLDSLIILAKETNLPMVVAAGSLEEAAEASLKAKSQGVGEMVIAFEGDSIESKIQKFTLTRRSALKKNARPLGYPFIAFTTEGDPDLELQEAVSYISGYANIIIVKNVDKDYALPLLTARQDIYTDPQKPVQVEPKVYEIGKVTPSSPVLVTTNFSITYFTVAGEVESSKVPSYIISCDSEGMSVLTAWAAEKFTAQTVTDAVNKLDIAGRVSHKKLIIPGYVAVFSSKLEELSGWKIAVGPREASGIPAFLKGWR